MHQTMVLGMLLAVQTQKMLRARAGRGHTLMKGNSLRARRGTLGKFLTGIGTKRKRSGKSQWLCVSLQDKALHCSIWYPFVHSLARRGSQGSVTQVMTGKGDKFCVRDLNKIMITSLRSVASIHAQSCYFAILSRVFFGRSFCIGFSVKSADPQRGVSKIWHYPRLIRV